MTAEALMTRNMNARERIETRAQQAYAAIDDPKGRVYSVHVCRKCGKRFVPYGGSVDYCQPHQSKEKKEDGGPHGR